MVLRTKLMILVLQIFSYEHLKHLWLREPLKEHAYTLRQHLLHKRIFLQKTNNTIKLAFSSI